MCTGANKRQKQLFIVYLSALWEGSKSIFYSAAASKCLFWVQIKHGGGGRELNKPHCSTKTQALINAR